MYELIVNRKRHSCQLHSGHDIAISLLPISTCDPGWVHSPEQMLRHSRESTITEARVRVAYIRIFQEDSPLLTALYRMIIL